MSNKWCHIDVNIYRDPIQCGIHDFNSYRDICKKYIDDLILQHQPEGFVIISPSEADIKTLYGECIELLKDYCTNNNKKIYVFCSCWPADYEKVDYVEFYSFPLYNRTHYLGNCGQFRESFEENDHHLKSIAWIGNKSPQLLYTCYNNRPSYYRSHTVDQLAKHDLLNKGMVTYRQMTMNDSDHTWDLQYVQKGTLLEDPCEKNFALNSTAEFSPNNIPASYNTGLIDIVTESRIGKNEYYLSEKTNKPLLTHKPFLVVSSPGYHKWLQDERGIEPYDEIFDYTFDSIEDDYLRIEGIIDNIKRLSEKYKTPEDLKQLYEIVKEKTMHNFWNYMTTMQSGTIEKSFYDFLGINSDERRYYSFDNVSKHFCNTLTTNELEKASTWMEHVVIPHIKDYDLQSSQWNQTDSYTSVEENNKIRSMWKCNHLESDVWPNYQKIFADNPLMLTTIKEKYLKHKWLNPIE